MQKMEDRLFNNKHLDAQIHSFLFTFIFKITRSNLFGLHTLCIHIFIEQTFLIIVKFNMDTQYGNVEYIR